MVFNILKVEALGFLVYTLFKALFLKMKKKNKLIKFFQKTKRAKKRKKFWKNLLSFKKRRKKPKKINEHLFVGLVLTGLLLVFLFVQQVIVFSQDLIQSEAANNYQKVQFELEIIENQIVEIGVDFENNLKLEKWSVLENRQLLETKIRRLNYLNSHLSKTIEAYNNDFSLQLYRSSLERLENVFREVRNVQLISSRIANKIDTLLLFDEINENQKELLEKDFDLFYEKINLINSF